MNDIHFQNLLQSAAGKFENGEALWNVLRQNRLPEMDIIICPEHIGDTLWICTYADAYKKHHHCSMLLFVVPEAQKDLPGLFPAIDDTLPISIGQMSDLTFYIGMKNLWYHEGIRYAHWHFRVEISADGLRYVEFFDPKLVPNIYDTMPISRCHLLDIPTGSSQTRFFADHPASDDIKEKYGNAVLLMPTALTQPGSIPLAFWEKLAAGLKENGYEVYCNYNSLPSEILIPGTIPLASSLLEMTELASAFRRFIGFRSGICDLLAMAGAPLTVIHPRYDQVPTIILPPDAPIVDHLYHLNQLESLLSYQYREEWEENLLDVILSGV